MLMLLLSDVTSSSLISKAVLVPEKEVLIWMLFVKFFRPDSTHARSPGVICEGRMLPSYCKEGHSTPRAPMRQATLMSPNCRSVLGNWSLKFVTSVPDLLATRRKERERMSRPFDSFRASFLTFRLSESLVKALTMKCALISRRSRCRGETCDVEEGLSI